MGFFNKKTFLKQWLPAFIFCAAVIVFYKIVDWIPGLLKVINNFLGILSPFFIGLAIALILYIPSNKFENLFKKYKNKFISKHARAFSVTVTYLIFIALVVLAFSFVIPKVVDSVGKLIDAIPGYYNQVSDFFTSKMDSNGKFYGIDVKKVLSLFTPEKVLSFLSFSSITPYISKVFEFGSALVTFFMSFIISVYMLLARERLSKSFKTFLSLFIPTKTLDRASRFLKSACDIFNTYIYRNFNRSFQFNSVFRCDNQLCGYNHFCPYFGRFYKSAYNCNCNSRYPTVGRKYFTTENCRRFARYSPVLCFACHHGRRRLFRVYRNFNRCADYGGY